MGARPGESSAGGRGARSLGASSGGDGVGVAGDTRAAAGASDGSGLLPCTLGEEGEASGGVSASVSIGDSSRAPMPLGDGGCASSATLAESCESAGRSCRGGGRGAGASQSSQRLMPAQLIQLQYLHAQSAGAELGQGLCMLSRGAFDCAFRVLLPLRADRAKIVWASSSTARPHSTGNSPDQPGCNDELTVLSS